MFCFIGLPCEFSCVTAFTVPLVSKTRRGVLTYSGRISLGFNKTLGVVVRIRNQIGGCVRRVHEGRWHRQSVPPTILTFKHRNSSSRNTATTAGLPAIAPQRSCICVQLSAILACLIGQKHRRCFYLPATAPYCMCWIASFVLTITSGFSDPDLHQRK